MDEPILKTPILIGSLAKQVEKAEAIYNDNFNGDAWFGRCIFLSWYCKRGTCDFCFRSTQKHKIKNPKNSRRSLGSVLAEAAFIKTLGWRLEFLTGGYGIYPFNELVQIAKYCSEILGEKLWLNLGVMKEYQLKRLRPYVKGIVSSLETLEPNLHNKVCPDKPIEPYLDMMEISKKMGYLQSFTLVIGLGEKKSDYNYAKDLIKKYNFDRVTIYALRPVNGTPYEKGPTPEQVIWWISKIRIDFPKIEIIAGSAAYRIPELSLFLKAGANAFTKLPATNIFNKEAAKNVESEVKKSGRNFISDFTANDIRNDYDWKTVINSVSLDAEQKEVFENTLNSYLDRMHKQKNK